MALHAGGGVAEIGGPGATPSGIPKVLNVTDDVYGGADTTGATDAHTAIQAAVDASGGRGDVFLPKGTFLLDASGVDGIKLPLSAAGLRIRGAGRGVTIVKLSANTPSFLLPARTADNQLFQNIEVSDLTVDANSVTGQHGVVIGTLGAGGWSTYGRRLNIRNLRVLRINTVNVPTGDYSGGAANYSRQNVSLVCKHLTTNEATQNSIKDVLVEDCNFQGGNVGVAVLADCNTGRSSTTLTGAHIATATSLVVASSANAVVGDYVNVGTGMVFETHVVQAIPDSTHITITSGLINAQAAGITVSFGGMANVLIDRVVVENLTHDCITSAHLVGSGSHANVQLGGVGFGGTCRVKGLYGYNSGDIGIETDGFMFAEHVDCYVEDARASAYLCRNFAHPEGVLNSTGAFTSQRCVYRNCHARITAAGLAPAQTTYQANGWQIGNSSAPSPMFGEALVEGCSFRSAQATYNSIGQAIQCYQAPIRRITVKDFTAILDSINYASGATPTVTPTVYMFMPDADCHLVFKDIRTRLAGTITVSAGSFTPYVAIYAPISSREMVITEDGFYMSGNIAGSGFNNWRVQSIGDATGCTVRGSFKRAEFVDWPTTNFDGGPRMFVIRGTAIMTIKGEIRIEDCDSGGIPGGGGFDVHFPDGGNPGNRDKVYLFNNRFKNTQAFGNWPHASVAMGANTFGTAAFTTATGNQYIGGVPAEIHFATGTGAGITLIEIGKTSGTYEQVYAQAAGAMAQDVLVPVDNGDWVKVTFATTQPTTRVRPRRL